jgi:PBP1b-binding outer membrane lipoprotein LpoB
MHITCAAPAMRMAIAVVACACLLAGCSTESSTKTGKNEKRHKDTAGLAQANADMPVMSPRQPIQQPAIVCPHWTMRPEEIMAAYCGPYRRFGPR